jgi:hypothetical protein
MDECSDELLGNESPCDFTWPFIIAGDFNSFPSSSVTAILDYEFNIDSDSSSAIWTIPEDEDPICKSFYLQTNKMLFKIVYRLRNVLGRL